MRSTHRTHRPTAMLLLAVVAGLTARPAVADDGPLVVRTATAKVKLIERSSRLVDLPDNITHVTDFDDSVVLVEAISATRVRVTGQSPGVTSVAFTDDRGVVRRLEVFVTGDTRHLEAHLRDLFPNTNVRAVAVGDDVVLRGFVSEPSQITQIVDIASTFYPQVYNQITVATDDRVMLYVKVAEVNRSKARRFGFNFAAAGGSGSILNATGGVGMLPSVIGGTVGVLEAPLANSNLVGTIISGSGSQYNAFLEALKTENLLKILAEPNVMATSGRPATLHSGGEFPILVPGGLGQTSISFKNYGILIQAVPLVLGNGRIRLDIAPEVSDLDFSNGVTLDGVRVPALSTRKVNTQAEMMFGETLVLGGLISTRTIGTTSKVPFLGDLPYVGAAFSRKAHEETETELLIMVTPMPAAPFGAGDCPPAGPGEHSLPPTDKELYFYNMLEAPRYGEPCGPVGCSNADGCPGGCGPDAGFGGLPVGVSTGPSVPFAGGFADPQMAAPPRVVPSTGGHQYAEPAAMPSFAQPPSYGPTMHTAPSDLGPEYGAPTLGGPSASRQTAKPPREGRIRLGSVSTGPATSGPVRQTSAVR